MDYGMALLIHNEEMYQKNKTEILACIEEYAEEGDICTAFILKHKEMPFLFIEGNTDLMDWYDITMKKDGLSEVIFDKNSFACKFFDLTAENAGEKMNAYYEKGIFREATRENCFEVLCLDENEAACEIFETENIETLVEDLLETVNEKIPTGGFTFIEEL